MVTLKNTLFLCGVTFALLVGIAPKSVEGLKCWVCSGHDGVEHQCSPDNKGELAECPGGTTATCELVEEKYSQAASPATRGKVYISRKCANGFGKASRVGTCAVPEVGHTTNVTNCYCNDKDNCNYDRIDGIGGASSGGGDDSDESGSGILVIVIIVIVAVLALVGGGLGYRWYSGRSRGSPIPSDD